MIRVMLADDHDLVRDGLSVLLAMEADMEIVASVADSEAAIAQALRLQPDVAVVDFQLPPRNGVAVAQALLDEGSPARVLLITGSQDPADIALILSSPASGAIHKRSAANELRMAIQALAQGDLYFSDSIAALRPANAAGLGQQLGKLTSREKEILLRVAQGASSADIAHNLSLQYETVRTHRRNLMRKLELNNSAQLTALAHKAGLM